MRSYDDIIAGLTSRSVQPSSLRALLRPYLEVLCIPEGLPDAELRAMAYETLRLADVPAPLRETVTLLGALSERTRLDAQEPGRQLELMSMLEPRSALAAALRAYLAHHPSRDGHTHRRASRDDAELKEATFTHDHPETPPWSELLHLHLCHVIQRWLRRRDAVLLHIAEETQPDALGLEVYRGAIDGRPGTVRDTLLLYPEDHELRVLSRWPQMHLFLAAAMGAVLFTDRAAFELEAAFTSTPLTQSGADALRAEDCRRIERVALTSLRFRDEEPPFDTVLWQGEDDLGARLDSELPRFLWRARLIDQFKLAVHVHGERRPIIVTIRPPSFFNESRSTHSSLVRDFLLRRGFLRQFSD